jgi:two-component system, NarL family, invasion response regulator UvrY
VMLVDDHAIVREGYRSLLQKQDHLRVVAEAGDGADAYRVYKEAKPDLVIMDVSMPGIGGVEAIRRIRQWDGSARILVFTMHQSAAYAVQATRAGARGFVTKSSPPDALLRAIGEVIAGRIALSPDIDHELVGRFLGSNRMLAGTEVVKCPCEMRAWSLSTKVLL